jgi:ABC-2 type transport system permease protein
MFTRIAISVVPAWQALLALGLDAITVAFCFVAAGRIYRVGMLLYGKLPSPKQILTALR